MQYMYLQSQLPRCLDQSNDNNLLQSISARILIIAMCVYCYLLSIAALGKIVPNVGDNRDEQIAKAANPRKPAKTREIPREAGWRTEPSRCEAPQDDKANRHLRGKRLIRNTSEEMLSPWCSLWSAPRFLIAPFLLFPIPPPR